MAAIGKVYIAVILVVFIFSSSCSHSINVKRVVPSKCTTVGECKDLTDCNQTCIDHGFQGGSCFGDDRSGQICCCSAL
ncbi:hypothetical protein QJS04_geneDACA010650 [Acorus gramineus]|uniref:Uncharacterized protein n=1 Tax=Acorus gramineus TaxID=55184 RepID=A0AAV9AJE0_ACOGR|nr:hypothetical protein QJS04_geneDACA010650 [Acorus gramineus]